METTRIFLDFEFTGLIKTTSPISLGITSSTGLHFYAEFSDYPKWKVDAWVQRHVVNNLYLEKDYPHFPTHIPDLYPDPDTVYVKAERAKVKKVLDVYLDSLCADGQIEAWVDCGAYDWVLFCDLYGGALKMRQDIYYIPFDLCTYMKMNGIDPDVNREAFAGETQSLKPKFKHNALWDAHIIKRCWNKIRWMETVNGKGKSTV